MWFGFVGNKISEENKKVKEDYYFEELLEKYQMYLDKDETKLPSFLSRGWRHSLPWASQPSIDSMKSDRMHSNRNNNETEVRLPSSTNKIMNEIGGALTSRKNFKNSKINDNILSTRKTSASNDKHDNPNSPVKSLPNIGSRNLNANSKLSQRFQTIKMDDKSRSMNNLVQNGVNIVNSLPNSKSKVSCSIPKISSQILYNRFKLSFSSNKNHKSV